MPPRRKSARAAPPNRGGSAGGAKRGAAARGSGRGRGRGRGRAAAKVEEPSEEEEEEDPAESDEAESPEAADDAAEEQEDDEDEDDDDADDDADDDVDAEEEEEQEEDEDAGGRKMARWTKEENDLLRKLMTQKSVKTWAQRATKLGTNRSASAVQKHWVELSEGKGSKKKRAKKSEEEDEASGDEAEEDAKGGLEPPNEKVTSAALGALLGVYAQLRTLNKHLRLSPFSVGHLMQSLCYANVNTLCGEIFVCLLRALTDQDTREALSDASGKSDQTTLSWLQLSGYTWPDLLRRYLQREHTVAENTVQADAIGRVLTLLEANPDFWSMNCATKLELLSFLCGHMFDHATVRGILEERAEYDDNDFEEGDHNTDYCATSGKGGALQSCDGCATSFREQFLEKHQRPSPIIAGKSTRDNEDGEPDWFCGFCVEKTWWSVRLLPLGSDRVGNNFWFIGGHFFWQDPQNDGWANLTLEDLEVRMRAWAPARGRMKKLQNEIEAHIPRHHHVDISPALQEAFTDSAKRYKGHATPDSNPNPNATGEAMDQDDDSGNPVTTPEDIPYAEPIMFENVSAGEEYDCLDPSPGWFNAQVVKKTATRILVHFKGWSKRHDRWIGMADVGGRVKALDTRAGTPLTDEDRQVLTTVINKSPGKVKPDADAGDDTNDKPAPLPVAAAAAAVAAAAVADPAAKKTDPEDSLSYSSSSSSSSAAAAAAAAAVSAAAGGRSDMPDVKFGIVDMMVNGKLLPVTTKPSELMKPCAELRTWTLESQAALWLQVMNFALKMMDFALKMMNFALKMMNFALRMMDFVFK